MNTRQIKYRMVSIRNTKQITRAMEAVAATKMRRAQEVAIRGRAYAEAALSILKELPSGRTQLHSLLAQRPGQKYLYILLGSDKGLCGAYNSNVLKVFKEQAEAGGEITVLPIGRKMRQFSERRSFRISPITVSWQTPLTERVRYIDAVAKAFVAAQDDKVFLYYPHFRTTLRQEAVVRQLLPFTRQTLREMVTGILPERGRFAALRREAGPEGPALEQPFVYEFEPGPRTVLGEVLRALLRVAAYHAFTEAEASEESARMVAMKNASENAATLLDELTLTFNKARQLAITREVAEITSGKEALENA